MIEIIPAIDIINGKCVRLSEGDYARTTIYDHSPVDMAKSFADCGVKRIHMVDLDGARQSSPANTRILEKVASAIGCEIEWGGGICDKKALDSIFSAGASQAVIGSVAALNPSLFREWLYSFGGDRIILGADTRSGKVAIKGWQEDSGIALDSLIGGFASDGLSQVICTDISRDGMLLGPSDRLYTQLQAKYPGIFFTVSGGISSMSDIERLNALGLRKVIVGKAIYENRITLREIEKWSQSE